MRLIFESVGDGKTAIDCTFADKLLKITAKPTELKKADK